MVEAGRKRSEPEPEEPQLTEADEKRIAEEAKAIAKEEAEKEKSKSEHAGGVLGLSDTPPEVEIPTRDRHDLDE
jgi:hypothetical protein